jgi:transposase
MQTQTNYVGIDISKSFFDVFITGRHYQFSNDQEGFKALSKLLTADNQVVMEASGPYYLELACYLHAAGVRVSVMNPLVIRRYSQMRMARAKTDKKDARLIAEYGTTMNPPQWVPPQKHLVALQQLQATVAGLTRQRTSLSNQLQSFISSGLLETGLKQTIQKELVHLDRLTIKLSEQMEQIVEAHYKQLLTNLTSVPGIGKKTAMLLIIISSGFERFDDYRKLSSYIGICPRIFESGSSIKGKTRICKMGMSGIRALLYICSWSAKRYNKACRELYERLIAKGKAKKLALMAVANKLLRQAFAVAKKQSKYQENYSLNTCF